MNVVCLDSVKTPGSHITDIPLSDTDTVLTPDLTKGVIGYLEGFSNHE